MRREPERILITHSRRQRLFFRLPISLVTAMETEHEEQPYFKKMNNFGVIGAWRLSIVLSAKNRWIKLASVSSEPSAKNSPIKCSKTRKGKPHGAFV